MKITIRYFRSSYTVELPDDATVAQLKDEITKLVNIPAENQKLTFHGTQLTESANTLSSYKIKNGHKILLVASGVDKNETNTTTQSEAPKTPQPTTPPQPDKAIVDLGPPAGALKSFQTEVTILPKEPLIVRTKLGLAKLQFETEGLFIQYVDKKEDNSDIPSERIFSTDIKSYSTEPNSKNKNDYFHLCLRLTNDERIFYFLPNQYKRIISNVVSRFLGNTTSPFIPPGLSLL